MSQRNGDRARFQKNRKRKSASSPANSGAGDRTAEQKDAGTSTGSKP